MTCAVILTVLGGVFELAGLALVVREIGADRKLAERRLANAENPPQFGFQGPPQDPRLIGFESPEERLEGVQKDVSRTTQAAQRATYAQRAALISFIRELLQGSLTERKIGVGLFAVGVILNVAGNVLAAT